MADADENPYQSPDYVEEGLASGYAPREASTPALRSVRCVIGIHLLGICTTVVYFHTEMHRELSDVSDGLSIAVGLFAFVTLLVCPILIALVAFVGNLSRTERLIGRLSIMETVAAVLVEAVLTCVHLVALLPAFS